MSVGSTTVTASTFGAPRPVDPLMGLAAPAHNGPAPAPAAAVSARTRVRRLVGFLLGRVEAVAAETGGLCGAVIADGSSASAATVAALRASGLEPRVVAPRVAGAVGPAAGESGGLLRGLDVDVVRVDRHAVRRHVAAAVRELGVVDPVAVAQVVTHMVAGAALEGEPGPVWVSLSAADLVEQADGRGRMVSAAVASALTPPGEWWVVDAFAPQSAAWSLAGCGVDDVAAAAGALAGVDVESVPSVQVAAPVVDGFFVAAQEEATARGLVEGPVAGSELAVRWWLASGRPETGL